MASLPLRVRIEDEMESYRDGIYNPLKILLQTPKKYLSESIKMEIHAHLYNYNWGETWTEDGEDLLGRAYAEIAQRQSEENNDDFWYGSLDDDATDDTSTLEAIKRFEEAVELWESRLNTGKTKNDGYDNKGRSNTHHRTGIKRDKAEFWSRPSPTRWHKHHQTLRKIRQEKKAKRQQAYC